MGSHVWSKVVGNTILSIMYAVNSTARSTDKGSAFYC